jgi:hypothetical protein
MNEPKTDESGQSGLSGGRGGGGDSGGGAYPNPHSGRKPSKDGFMGSGGQSGMEYHGAGQLGEKKEKGNPNAPAAGESRRGPGGA